MAKLGEIVTYYLTAADVTAVETRRVDGDSIKTMPAGYVHGLVTHGGNPVTAGQACPAIVTKKNADGTYNVRLFLDGTGGLWVQNAALVSSLTPTGSRVGKLVGELLDGILG